MNLQRSGPSSPRRRRLGPIAFVLTALACGHVGLDLGEDGATTDDETDSGDGDQTTSASGSNSFTGDGSSTGDGGSTGDGSGGRPLFGSGGRSSSGGTGGEASGSGGEEAFGGMGGEPAMGGADGTGGFDGTGGSLGGACDPTCVCNLSSSLLDLCELECMQSPCQPVCADSCDVFPVGGESTKVELECQEGATCLVGGPSDNSELLVGCTGFGSCQVDCGSAENCKTVCQGSGTCLTDCRDTGNCDVNCEGRGACGMFGDIADSLNCTNGKTKVHCPNSDVIACGEAACGTLAAN